MVLSLADKFLYIRNPKTASKTAIHLFTTYQKKGKDCATNIEVDGQTHSLQDHKSYARLSEILESREDIKLDEYFKFMTVRNPWDRMVSYFLFHKKKGYHQCKNMDEFLKHYSKDSRLRKEHHLYPQLWWAKDSNGKIAIDYFIRFENLEEDWYQAMDKIGYSRIAIPKLNVTPNRKPYSSYYTDESRRRIAELFKEDIEYFGYKFEEKVEN